MKNKSRGIQGLWNFNESQMFLAINMALLHHVAVPAMVLPKVTVVCLALCRQLCALLLAPSTWGHSTGASFGGNRIKLWIPTIMQISIHLFS